MNDAIEIEKLWRLFDKYLDGDVFYKQSGLNYSIFWDYENNKPFVNVVSYYIPGRVYSSDREKLYSAMLNAGKEHLKLFYFNIKEED